jgi:hypothetical protein
MKSLREPTQDFVQSYVGRFNRDQKIVEQALTKVFHTFPNNTSSDEVLIKVVTLNSLYVTNIYATGEVAENIVRHCIDDRLKAGDLELVNDIAPIVIKGKVRRNYSFASKYCSWHFPEEYPIYDRFVDNLLWAYQRQHMFSGFKRYDLWNSYVVFNKAIRDFQRYFQLQKFSIRQLDNFLWLYGKEYSATGDY